MGFTARHCVVLCLPLHCTAVKFVFSKLNVDVTMLRSTFIWITKMFQDKNKSCLKWKFLNFERRKMFFGIKNFKNEQN